MRLHAAERVFAWLLGRSGRGGARTGRSSLGLARFGRSAIGPDRTACSSLEPARADRAPFAEAPFYAVALFAAALCALRLLHAAPYAASWDAVDFALALDRFDLLAMQPHFPGYPYFILAAKALLPLIGDPVAALSAVGAFGIASAALPMYALMRSTIPPKPAAVAAALAQASAYVGLAAAMPMSEAFAVTLLWWFAWSAYAAWTSPRYGVRLLPAFAFGLLMGVRLSYLAFGLLLAPLLLREASSGRRGATARALGFAAAAVASQLLWVAALVATEGSVVGFAQLSFEFAKGHFTEWGGAATADASIPFVARLVRLVVYNYVWIGLCGASAWNAISLAIAAGAVMLAYAGRMKRGRDGAKGSADGGSAPASGRSAPASGAGAEASDAANGAIADATAGASASGRLPAPLLWGLAACAAYFLWALFAQNVDKPRHILPLVGPALWLVVAALWRASPAGRRRVFWAVSAAALLAQTLTGAQLLRVLKTETPAVVQLHRHMESVDAPFLLFTWEETRVLQGLGAEYPHKRVFTYELAEEERRARPERDVYVTDKVLEGFERQRPGASAEFAPVATFRSDAVVEPVYHEITLYEWRKAESP